MANDWIKLYRKLQEHPLWNAEPFTRGQAWVDLLLSANWAPGHIRVRGARVDLQRGQLAGSFRFLAERWKWSTTKVSAFLEELKKDTQIKTVDGFITQVIEIVNYDDYQNEIQEKIHGEDAEKTPERRGEDETKKKQEQLRRNNKKQKDPPKSPKGELVTCQEFFDRWNKFAANNPPLKTCRKLTDNRQEKIRTRLAKPGWFADFREAVCALPLGGDGWQPDFDWLIKSEHSIYRILEGAYDWRLKEDPALEKLQKDKRRRAAEQRKIELEQQKRQEKLDSVQVRSAIESILPQKDGNGDETVESSLLFG